MGHPVEREKNTRHFVSSETKRCYLLSESPSADFVVPRRRADRDVSVCAALAPRPAALRVAVLPARDAEQEGAGRRRVLVRGRQRGRRRQEQERHSRSRR